MRINTLGRVWWQHTVLEMTFTVCLPDIYSYFRRRTSDPAAALLSLKFSNGCTCKPRMAADSHSSTDQCLNVSLCIIHIYINRQGLEIHYHSVAQFRRVHIAGNNCSSYSILNVYGFTQTFIPSPVNLRIYSVCSPIANHINLRLIQ